VRRFLASVNTICFNVLHGAPRALGPNPTAKQITAYAIAAEAAAKRMTVSLSNLHGPTTDLVLLRTPYADYQRLQAIYGAVLARLKGTRPSAFVGQIERLERKTAVDAIASHLPACDPHANTGGTLRPR
jgi:hypothetical protein